MNRAPLFLALALLGLALQLAVVGVFLSQEGLDVGEIGSQMVETTMAVLAITDLGLTAIAFLVWLPGEARRAGIERWWPYAVAVLGGVCFALPLFLAAREREREGAPAAA